MITSRVKQRHQYDGTEIPFLSRWSPDSTHFKLHMNKNKLIREQVKSTETAM